MVVGYLDIFVFEELCFAFGPVVDSIDGIFKGYARVGDKDIDRKYSKK